VPLILGFGALHSFLRVCLPRVSREFEVSIIFRSRNRSVIVGKLLLRFFVVAKRIFREFFPRVSGGILRVLCVVGFVVVV